MFHWINDNLLKMEPLSQGVHFLLQKLGIDTSQKLGESIHFFIYDVIKIFILLSVLIFIISYIQHFFPPEKTKRILSRFRGVVANLIGALLGTVTPFCSCSSIPIFIGFTNAGLPIGVTFSFLISSPLVDLASVLLLASIFNWQIALTYILVGLMLAVIGGGIISRAHMEKYVEPFVYQAESVTVNEVEPSRFAFCKHQVRDIIQRVWLYIIIGVGIGALIHNWIPESVITAILGQDKWYSVLIATLVGIPMYADIFGALPIAEALVYKGVGIGTALAFMMAVTALSLPSLILLKKVVKTKLLVTFVGIVTIGILVIGYVFNAMRFLFPLS